MSPFESLFFCGLYATLPSSVQLLNAEMMDRMLRTTLINNTDSIDQVAQPSMRDALAYLIQCSVRSFNIWLLGSLKRILTVNNYSPLQSLYRQMLFFPYALCNKIYCLELYHLLDFTLHSKAIQTLLLDFIAFAYKIYMQMRVEKKQSICLQILQAIHATVSHFVILCICSACNNDHFFLSLR